MLSRNDTPPLQSLVVFESAARLLSFTAAARELGTTQPAVSQQIRSLETELGVALFARVYRGVTLTDAGYLLLETTQKSLKELRDVVQKIKQNTAPPRINFATDFAFAAYWLMPKLAEFRRLHPDIDIRIQTSQSEIDLVSADADIAMLFGDGHYTGYHSEKLLIEHVYPVCSPKLFEQYQGFSSFEDLSQAPLLKLNADLGQKWLDWEAVFAHHHTLWQSPEALMEFDNYTLVVQAAISGQGVALGWSPLLDSFIESGVLMALKHFAVTTDHGYHIVMSKQQAPSEQVRLFLNWLKSQMDNY